MTTSEQTSRRRGPSWLRVLAGAVVFLVGWLCLAVLSNLALPEAFYERWDLVIVPGLAVGTAAGAWFLLRHASTRRAVALSLAVLFCGVTVMFIAALVPEMALPPRPAPGEVEAPPSVEKPGPQLPQFPWPPPAASATYVLPDRLFAAKPTIGDVAEAIVSALEQNGYVERGFFATPAGGAALVTRLERINDDGSSAVGDNRWPATQKVGSDLDLLSFLRGLFFVDAGHYRVIVFVLQDMPFSQSSRPPTEEEARAWLRGGANVLPPEIARLPFKGGHCTALIYEFASDGASVRLVDSPLTAKQHLEKAGVLPMLDKVN